MPKVSKPINSNDIIKLYNSGKSISELTKLFRCRDERIKKILVDNGIEIRNPNIRKELPVDEIASLYNSGMSENALAKKFSVSRNVIRRRLEEAHVVIRGRTEANQLMMSKRTSDENARNSRAAHDAVRGKTYSHEELCKRAFTREQTFTEFTSPYERAIADELTNRGIKFIPQKAIDKYNIDFAVFDNIALEVYGGGWHAYGSAAARFNERSKKIFDSRYTIVLCWIGFNYEFIPSAIVDYLISLNDILSSDPTSRGKHYMIRGDGERCTIGNSNLDYIS